MDLRPPQHVRWNIFKATAIYLQLLTIVTNICISRCCRSPRSTSDNSILFYDDYDKSMLTSLMSEFLAVRHLGGICFLNDDWKEMSHVSKFVFWYFDIFFGVCNVNFKEIFALHVRLQYRFFWKICLFLRNKVILIPKNILLLYITF